MNTDKKLERQRRRIDALQKQVKDLEQENNALRIKNLELTDKMRITEDLQKEYRDSIAEIHKIREEYQQAVYEAKKMTKGFTSQFKPLIKRLKTQV